MLVFICLSRIYYSTIHHAKFLNLISSSSPAAAFAINHNYNSQRKIKYSSSRIYYYNNSDATFNSANLDSQLLLILSGDIQLNPGPQNQSELSTENRQTPPPSEGHHNHQDSQSKIHYTSKFLLQLRFTQTIQLHYTVLDKIQYFGIKYRPRGRRARRLIQQRATRSRAMDMEGRHLAQTQIRNVAPLPRRATYRVIRTTRYRSSWVAGGGSDRHYAAAASQQLSHPGAAAETRSASR